MDRCLEFGSEILCLIYFGGNKRKIVEAEVGGLMRFRSGLRRGAVHG